ncbi:QueT transporter family protein [Ornithinibacillus gellani]|uniref:QueT transporter family protein n=1 Tax=Ornithinibacillus gellani TaxID=2293253 RepID=UPI00295898DF|nr:QueT transporter family protein [Ornithinibacillus gellani]
MNINIRTLVTNGVLAALYIAATALVAPIAFSNIQFRLSEIFNHLIVFDKRYFWGIAIGVFFANLFMSTLGAYELLGLSQTIISLLITMGFGVFIKNKLVLMVINTVVFTCNMWIIALMLNLAIEVPFFITWMTTAAGELIVMSIGIAVIWALHQRLRFDRLFDYK